jgi:hypothetical protein
MSGESGEPEEGAVMKVIILVVAIVLVVAVAHATDKRPGAMKVWMATDNAVTDNAAKR